jgi:hypothetical protein
VIFNDNKTTEKKLSFIFHTGSVLITKTDENRYEALKTTIENYPKINYG